MKKFSRKQLVKVVECMIDSEIAMIGRFLPDEAEAQKPSDEFVENVCWHLGWNLSILYAQITGDGMGEYDALHCCDKFDEVLHRLVEKSWEDGGKKIRERQARKGSSGYRIRDLYGATYPNARDYAVRFVDQTFDEYLGSKPKKTSPSVILAVADCQIIGCVDPGKYEGAEAAWPHGWAELLNGPAFDQVDVELCDEFMVKAFLDHYRPNTAQAEPPKDDTLSWDDVEDHLMEALHTTSGGDLADLYNKICDTRPKIAYDGDSGFRIAE